MRSAQQFLRFFLHDETPLFCRTGRTLGSIVRWWHRKFGSMPGMSEADHANASRWREITAATSTCSSWLNNCPILNTLPPICLSTTLSIGWGRLSHTLSVRDSLLWPSLLGVASSGTSGEASSDTASMGEASPGSSSMGEASPCDSSKRCGFPRHLLRG